MYPARKGCTTDGRMTMLVCAYHACCVAQVIEGPTSISMQVAKRQRREIEGNTAAYEQSTVSELANQSMSGFVFHMPSVRNDQTRFLQPGPMPGS